MRDRRLLFFLAGMIVGPVMMYLVALGAAWTLLKCIQLCP